MSESPWLDFAKSLANPVVRIYLAFRLVRCMPMTGYTAYKDSPKWLKGRDPDYLACATCYEQARRVPLQLVRAIPPDQKEPWYARFICPVCQTTIKVGLEDPIIPRYGELKGPDEKRTRDLSEIAREINRG